MLASRCFLSIFIHLWGIVSLAAFIPVVKRRVAKTHQAQIISVGGLQERSRQHLVPLFDKKEGKDNTVEDVLELPNDTKDLQVAENVIFPGTAPFLSQGKIDRDALNLDLTDPKQTRVIIYIILSLLPVLFLIPLMLGSREMIPLESIPPVQL